MQRVAYFLSFFLLLNFFSFSQNITADQQKKIDEYYILVNKYKYEGNTSSVANILSKIGNIYISANNTQNAISTFNEALIYVNNTQNKAAQIQINNQLGYLYIGAQDYLNAEKYFLNVYNLIIKTNNKQDIASAAYNLGGVYQNQKKTDLAIKKYEEALAIGLELDNLEMVKNIASKLALCYKDKGDEQNFIKYYNLSANFEKKIADIEIQKKQQELMMQSQISKQNQMKLEIQKFQNKLISDSLAFQEQQNFQNKTKIDSLNKEKRIRDLEIKNKQQELQKERAIARSRRTIIFTLLAGLIFLAFLLIVISRMYMLNKKQAKQLELLYIALESRNKELEENRKELARKNKQITDSINYASKIQQAILPMRKMIEQNFKESFILYLPRDVVSGDFYWFVKMDNEKIVAAIDCTGHSVPGAFMSLIANTLLNEIIKAKKITKLNEVLDMLNQGIMDTLHSEEKENEDINDGMDISLYKFTEGSRIAKFAASNHTSLICIDGETKILEGSFYSLGSLTNNRKDFHFSELEIDLGNEAIIYMYSDGYIDQFNDRQVKYSSKRFFNFIKSIKHLSLKEQEDKLHEELDLWRNEHRQIDDILVLGLKI